MPLSNSFVESLPKLPVPEQMRGWDATASDFGMPTRMLMENAGFASASLLKELIQDINEKHIWLFMGSGNNGGDCACMARHLLQMNAQPIVFHTHPLDKYNETAAWHINFAQKCGVSFHKLTSFEDGPMPISSLVRQILAFTLRAPAAIVDGLLGTGFQGELRPDVATLVSAINDARQLFGCPLLAIDTPSGLNCVTGQPSPIAIIASATITLEAAKPGLVLPHAKKWVGQVYVRKIGFPKAIEKQLPADWRLLDGCSLLEPQKFLANSYKNIYGHIYVIGGRSGMEGAAHLACVAALRSGAGLVTAIAPKDSLAQIRCGWSEIMTHICSPGTDWPEETNLPEEFAKGTLVVGPGFGRNADSAAFLKFLLNLENRPAAVFDADALMIMSKNRHLLGKLTRHDIITPHPGEAAALLETTATEIQANRAEALEKLKDLTASAIILKGSATLTGQQNQPGTICPYDIPQLAIAGSGDILAGCAGAMLALKKFGPDSCAAMAVIRHMIAGLCLAVKYPRRGAVAHDLANELANCHEFIHNLPKDADGITPWPCL